MKLGPGTRTGKGRQQTSDALRALYAGTTSSLVLDPGVGQGLLTGTQIIVPPWPVDRTYICRGYAAWSASTHGARGIIFLDGSSGTPLWGSGVEWARGGDRFAFTYLGPAPVVVPGDGQQHTLAIYMSDSGATGNMTFVDRFLSAIPVMP